LEDEFSVPYCNLLALLVAASLTSEVSFGWNIQINFPTTAKSRIGFFG
jgi:hypothetical protein